MENNQIQSLDVEKINNIEVEDVELKNLSTIEIDNIEEILSRCGSALFCGGDTGD